MTWERVAGTQDVGLSGLLVWSRGVAVIARGRGRRGDGVMGDEDGWCEAVADLEHSKGSLWQEAVGPLRLLRLLRVPLYLWHVVLLCSPGLAVLQLGLRGLLHLLRLRPANMIGLPGTLEGVQELIQAQVSLHELLQQLL